MGLKSDDRQMKISTKKDCIYSMRINKIIKSERFLNYYLMSVILNVSECEMFLLPLNKKNTRQ